MPKRKPDHPVSVSYLKHNQRSHTQKKLCCTKTYSEYFHILERSQHNYHDIEITT